MRWVFDESVEVKLACSRSNQRVHELLDHVRQVGAGIQHLDCVCDRERDGQVEVALHVVSGDHLERWVVQRLLLQRDYQLAATNFLDFLVVAVGDVVLVLVLSSAVHNGAEAVPAWAQLLSLLAEHFFDRSLTFSDLKAGTVPQQGNDEYQCPPATEYSEEYLNS